MASSSHGTPDLPDYGSSDLLSDLTAPSTFTAEEINAALQAAIGLGWCQHGEADTGEDNTIPISSMDMERVLQAAWEQSGRWQRVQGALKVIRSEVGAFRSLESELLDEIDRLRREKLMAQDELEFRETVEAFFEWLQAWHSGLLAGFNQYAKIKEILGK